MSKDNKQETFSKPNNFSNLAFSRYERNGQWHVIEVKFDPETLKTTDARIVESNPDRFIIDERLHVLLLGNDLV